MTQGVWGETQTLHGVVSFEEGPEEQEDFYRKGVRNKRLSTFSFHLLITIYLSLIVCWASYTEAKGTEVGPCLLSAPPARKLGPGEGKLIFHLDAIPPAM